MQNSIIHGKIIEVNNGQDGYQPQIVVEGVDGNNYIVTATPERKFIVSSMLS